MEYLIMILLTILSLMFLSLIYTKLLSEMKSLNRNINDQQDNNDNDNLLGSLAPKFDAISIQSGQTNTFEQIIKKDTVLIFFNSECAYCNNNFELFLNEIYKYPDLHFAIILEQNEQQFAESFNRLYNYSFDIYLVEQRLIDNYQLQFYPAFVLVDKQLIIKTITPIPYSIFKNTLSA